MLLEAVKQSDGTLIGVMADDDGKLILSAGDITVESLTVDNVVITNDEESPIPIIGTVTLDAASLKAITDKLDELIALIPSSLTTAGNLKVSIEEDKTLPT